MSVIKTIIVHSLEPGFEVNFCFIAVVTGIDRRSRHRDTQPLYELFCRKSARPKMGEKGGREGMDGCVGRCNPCARKHPAWAVRMCSPRAENDATHNKATVSAMAPLGHRNELRLSSSLAGKPHIPPSPLSPRFVQITSRKGHNSR